MKRTMREASGFHDEKASREHRRSTCYVLKAGYLGAYALYGPNRGEYLSVPNLGVLWLLAAVLSVPLYFPTRGFARWKRRRRDLAWLRYF